MSKTYVYFNNSVGLATAGQQSSRNPGAFCRRHLKLALGSFPIRMLGHHTLRTYLVRLKQKLDVSNTHTQHTQRRQAHT